ncbi:MAG: TadE/TadG family type IV pilus assembly protein [Pseudomonadota bacterium]
MKRISAPIGRLWRHFIGFIGNCRGVAAIEFAIILPVMVVMFIGTFELSRAITVDRRFDNAANSTADLITRLNDIDDAQFDGIMEIIEEIMIPYAATPLQLTASSVIVGINDPDNTPVCWSLNYNGGVNTYTEGQQFQLPTGLVVSGESVIVVEAEYLYTPTLFSLFIEDAITFKETIYIKPRVSSQVRYNNVICPLPTT